MSGLLDVSAYLPHRGPMLLLDGIEYIEQERAACWAQLDAGHAPAALLAADGSLPGYFAIELMAQTIGVWAGCMRQLRGASPLSMGLLLGVRDLQLEVGRFASRSRLEIAIEVLVDDGRTGSFSGTIRCAAQVLARGSLTTLQSDNFQELAGIFRL